MASEAQLDRRRDLVALLAVLAPQAWLIRRYWYVCDDAYISFRYARSWAEGDGLRFNPGSSPPVEGFSNPLWVALEAVLYQLGMDLPGVVPVISMLLAVGLVARIFVVLRRDLKLGRVAATAAAAAVAWSPAMAVWSTSGLETMALLTLLWLALEGLWLPRGRAWAPLALVGVVLIRVEGLAWALALLGTAAVGRRPVGLSALAVASSAAVALGLRQWWFGGWVSNTAVAKVDAQGALLARGLRYLGRNIVEQPLLLLGLVLPAWAARRSAVPGLVLSAWALAGCAAAMGVLVGGDFMPLGRLLLPIWLAVGLAIGLTLGALRGHAVLPAAVAAVLLSMLPYAGLRAAPDAVWRALNFREDHAAGHTELRIWGYEVEVAQRYAGLGAGLGAVTRGGDSVVMGPIGVIGWLLPGRILYDNYGLVTPEVAALPMTRLVKPGHDKEVDPFFFLEKQPTVLFASLVTGTQLAPALSPFVDELRRRGLTDRYAPLLVRVQPDADVGSPRFVFVIRSAAQPAQAWQAWARTLDAPLQVPAVDEPALP